MKTYMSGTTLAKRNEAHISFPICFSSSLTVSEMIKPKEMKVADLLHCAHVSKLVHSSISTGLLNTHDAYQSAFLLIIVKPSSYIIYMLTCM